MPVLRSREIPSTVAEPPPPSSSPPQPTTPSVVSDAGGSSAPRRRSLRLAALSGGDQRGLAVPTPSSATRGRVRRSSSRSSPTNGADTGSGSVSLRSGSRIARRSLGVVPDGSSDPLERDVEEGESERSTLTLDGVSGDKEMGVNDEEKGNAEWTAEEEIGLDVTTATMASEGIQDLPPYGNKSAKHAMIEMESPRKRKFGAEEKGKGKLVVKEESQLVDGLEEVELMASSVALGEVGEPSHHVAASVKRRKTRRVSTSKVTEVQSESRRAAGRNLAIELAPKFAFFKPGEEGRESDGEDDEEPMDEAKEEKEDWPGPFSTALKIIEEREEKLMARELNSASQKDECSQVKIQWTPLNGRKDIPFKRSAPSLQSLSLKVLCENVEEIESLEAIPDTMKHRLTTVLCSSRKMSFHSLSLLLSGSPAEIRLRDCSWASEKQFEEAFARCNTENLKVLQIELSGRCLPDYILRTTFAQSPNCLPSLTTVSLKGSYRISDDGLNALVDSAPLLSSINLSQCSLITCDGITTLANKLDSVLKELYLDDCQNLDAMSILPALMKLSYLEVLSMSGIDTVSDKFVRKLVPACGAKLRELRFACCLKVSGASMKIIGGNCPQLRAIDLRNLHRLNDSALEHLANGCRIIQTLKLKRNSFSDEAVAAFLEASGGSLVELSLNNIEKVSQCTAIAISRRCSSTLQSLDLSFCRKMTDEALGLIVDNCSYLQILKLFGCTQVTDVFLKGHSNSLVKIIGLNGPILEQFEMPDFL